jgi:predicted Zn-dependent protease
MNFIPRFFLAAAVAAVATFSSGCQTIRTLELQSSKSLINYQQEATLGQDFSKQIESETAVFDDPQVTAWVERVGNELVKHSPPTEVPFTFQVTKQPEVNAFAIPGGFCYINAGLILQADNEAEVVAVVGHEINHVTTRHGVRHMQRALGVELLTQLAAQDPRGAQLIPAVKQIGGVYAMRSFGREDEREADRLGVEAMYAAGYDPRMAASFFRKLKALEQENTGGNQSLFAQLQSTHPATQERIDNIEEQIATLDMTRPLKTNSEEFVALQAHIRTLMEAAAKEQPKQ